MRRRRTFKRFFQIATFNAACLALMGYFAWYGVYGEYGVFQLTRIEERIEIRTAELTRVSEQRERMERRVHLLQPGAVDPDMLDEQSRSSLGYSRPDELTIYWSSVTR